jgi:hypothetical protein
MKTFLAIYTGTPEAFEKAGWKTLSDQERNDKEKLGMKAWHEWGEKHRASIVDNGAPLGKTKHVSKDGISDIRNNMAGYTVVRAESQEAAARLFIDHPHFTVFPGQGVEIMECLPIPTL